MTRIILALILILLPSAGLAQHTPSMPPSVTPQAPPPPAIYPPPPSLPPTYQPPLQASSVIVSPDLPSIAAIINERDRQYSQRFEAQEKAVAAALSAAKEAVLKAEAASEKRFESINEFRNTLKDQQTALVTRNEVDIRFKALENTIASLSTRIAENSARSAGAEWLWGVIVGVGGLLIGVMSAFFAYQRSRTAS